MKYNPLLDKEFLIQLDNQKVKDIYAKITALNYQEIPMESIEGRVTGGSVNIDGASAVRRTCSITLVAQDVNINDFYWGLHTKFVLWIGVSNRINSKYDDIIWFKQGTFLITNFSTSLSNNNYTINITGKDKMCLLNGDIGGNIPASIDLGVITTILPNGTELNEDLPLKTIIKELLYSWGGEPYHNIVINDIEDKGIELLEYGGDSSLFMFKDITTGIVNYIGFDDGKTTVVCKDPPYQGVPFLLKDIPLRHLESGAEPLRFSDLKDDSSLYYIMRREYGETIGYRETDLTYPGKLVNTFGETVTSVLDKIKKVLGDFEYFYDIDGKFIFQRKQTYANIAWNPIDTDGDGVTYINTNPENSSVVYNFDNSNLITAFSNSPNLQNLRNDFSIWGQKKSKNSQTSKDALMIRMRYAIDKKPQKYVTYSGETFLAPPYDWRELIYQMAIDYRKNNQKGDFLATIGKNNPEYFPTGYTGYEKYYTDIEGFWRTLYNPNTEVIEPDPNVDIYYAKFKKYKYKLENIKDNTITEEKILPEKFFISCKLTDTYEQVAEGEGTWQVKELIEEVEEWKEFPFNSENITIFEEGKSWGSLYTYDEVNNKYIQILKQPDYPDDVYETTYYYQFKREFVAPLTYVRCWTSGESFVNGIEQQGKENGLIVWNKTATKTSHFNEDVSEEPIIKKAQKVLDKSRDDAKIYAYFLNSNKTIVKNYYYIINKDNLSGYSVKVPVTVIKEELLASDNLEDSGNDTTGITQEEKTFMLSNPIPVLFSKDTMGTEIIDGKYVTWDENGLKCTDENITIGAMWALSLDSAERQR